MAKTLSESPVTTATARAKLPAGMHWRELDRGVHLGYRRGRRGGEWLVRYRDGAGYKRLDLGTSDDVLTADGKSVFSYGQAIAEARRKVEAARAAAVVAAAGPVPTVRSVIEAYIAKREAAEARQRAGKPLMRDARSRLTKHVLAKDIAGKALHELSERALKTWREDLAETALQPASVKRVVNDFKAALNRAAEAHRLTVPALAGAVKAAFSADENETVAAARDVRPLRDTEVRSVIAAAAEVDAADKWEGDLYRMMLLLAATGARFGQVAAIRIADVEPANDRIMVPVSLKGRGKKQKPSYAVQIGEDVLEALRPAIARRKSNEPLLVRWWHKQHGPGKWERDRRGPWMTARELTTPWLKIAAKAGLSVDVTPYVLRHSSIVRGLRAGLPIRLVAALHDTSAVMIERHYARWIVDTETEAARRAIVALAPVPTHHAAE